MEVRAVWVVKGEPAQYLAGGRNVMADRRFLGEEKVKVLEVVQAAILSVLYITMFLY